MAASAVTEHAQVTALPLCLGIVAVVSWVGITGAENLAMLQPLLPVGSATEVIVNAWNGGVPVMESALLLVPTLSGVVVAIVLASKLFRREPRR